MISTNRPKIDVPKEPIDLIIDLSSATILILIIVYTLIVYPELRETIPIHFDGSGQADGFGNKSTLWLLPGIAIVLFLGLFILNRYPHLHNYMVNITPENALKNYTFSTRVLRIVNLLCAILFAFIQYKMIAGAQEKAAELGSWFLPIVIGTSVLLPIILIYYQNKLNK